MHSLPVIDICIRVQVSVIKVLLRSVVAFANKNITKLNGSTAVSLTILKHQDYYCFCQFLMAR